MEVRLHDKVPPTYEYLRWNTVELFAGSTETAWAKWKHMSPYNIRWEGDMLTLASLPAQPPPHSRSRTNDLA